MSKVGKRQKPKGRKTSGPKRPKPIPRDARQLVNAVFQRINPVTTAARLLRCKADATVAKTWTLMLEYRYGKPVQHLQAQGADGAPVTVQLVTTVPRPLREYESGAVIEEEET